MRSFIALEFDEKTKRQLKLIQNKVKEESLKGSWVYSDNFHLTLKFLGEIDHFKANEIIEKLDYISQLYEPITLNFNDLGYFKGKSDLRVVWVGINGEMDILESIYQKVEDDLYSLGFKKGNNKFKPHITLGRRIVLREPFKQLKMSIKTYLDYGFQLNKITLMKSEQVMKKRVYTPIKSNNLKKIYHS